MEFSQNSSWKPNKSGVIQGSVLGPQMFLIWINDLPVNLRYICKTFADSTSLFTKIFEKHALRFALNDDLEMTNNWAFQWKSQLNQDPSQAHKVYSSRKANNLNSLDHTLNNSKVASS